jgi:hypothetical protein
MTDRLIPGVTLFSVPSSRRSMAGKSQGGSSKKPQSEHKKLARARCYATARRRHEETGRQQELRHQHNLRLARDGELTPWLQAEAGRAARRLNTCGICRDAQLDEDGKCPHCGNTLNLKATWEKKSVK